MYSNAIRPSDLVTAPGAHVVEATVVWGRGADASPVATKRFRAGQRIVLGEGGDFALPIERTEIDAVEQGPVALGAFTVLVRGVDEKGELAASKSEMVLGGALPQVGVSALGHGLLVAAFAFFMPAMTGVEDEGVSRDQILAMKALLNASAEQETTPPPADERGAAETSDHSGGQRSQGSEGAMGGPKPSETKKALWTAAGDARPEDATLARERARREAMEFGMIGLLASAAPSDPNAPVVPWGSALNGSDKTSHAGNLWMGDVGDVFGYGLGLSGTGEGGGCTNGDCRGIGLSDVGGLGKSLDNRVGSGTCMVGPCNGHGSAIVGGGHDAHGPVVRWAKEIEVGGHLPAEVIQREVRLHQGAYRACYEDGLRRNPSLQGRVEVRFVIARDGSIQIAQDGASDLPDTAVRACVVKSFYSLSFASPGGQVRVTYPLVFVPSDG